MRKLAPQLSPFELQDCLTLFLLFHLISGLFWSVYALGIKDMYLLTPNAIGAGLAAIQILLYIVFGKSAKKA